MPIFDTDKLPRFPAGGAVGLGAFNLAQAGRNEDSSLLGGEVAHISSAESDLLRSLGGAGTINPVTGLPEYFNAGAAAAAATAGATAAANAPPGVPSSAGGSAVTSARGSVTTGLGPAASMGGPMGFVVANPSVSPSVTANVASPYGNQGFTPGISVYGHSVTPPPPPPSNAFQVLTDLGNFSPFSVDTTSYTNLPTINTNAYISNNPGIYVTDNFGNYVTNQQGVPVQSPILTAVQQAQQQAAYQMAVERGKQTPQYRLESKLAEPPPSIFQKIKQGIMQVVPDIPLGKEAKSVLSNPVTSFLSRSPVAVIAKFLAEGLQAQTPENVLATTLYNANPAVQAQQALMNQPYPTKYSLEEAGLGSLV